MVVDYKNSNAHEREKWRGKTGESKSNIGARGLGPLSSEKVTVKS